jgi:hypothetical protein
MKSLFDLSEELRLLGESLQENDGELSPELEAWFDNLQGDIADKLDNYCALITRLEAYATARRYEATRLAALASTDSNLAKRLHARLFQFLQAQKLNRLDTTRYRLTIAKNGGAAPLLIPGEWEEYPENAPERYHRHVIQLDKKAIRADIEAGEGHPECALGERGQHLRIK